MMSTEVSFATASVADLQQLAGNPAVPAALRIVAARAVFLRQQPVKATVTFAVPDAAGEGDDAFVFLGGFTSPAALPDVTGPEAGAAFMLKVLGENLDACYIEQDTVGGIDLCVDYRSVEEVTAALRHEARAAGRSDLVFTHDPALPVAVQISADMRTRFPNTVISLH
jgi:hypothetical protein